MGKESELIDLPNNVKIGLTLILGILLITHIFEIEIKKYFGISLQIDQISLALAMLIIFLWVFKFISRFNLPGGGGFDKEGFRLASKEKIIEKLNEETKEVKTEVEGKLEVTISNKGLKEIEESAMEVFTRLNYFGHLWLRGAELRYKNKRYTFDGVILDKEGFSPMTFLEVRILPILPSKRTNFIRTFLLERFAPVLDAFKEKNNKWLTLIIVSKDLTNEIRLDLQNSFEEFQEEYQIQRLKLAIFDLKELGIKDFY